MDFHSRDLRYFVAVAEENSFSRAAERLFVSQPLLSRQVAKLERDLRVRLLERTHRQVRLTSAGEVLLALGNSVIHAHPGVVFIPVPDLPLARLALVRRANDARNVTREALRAVRLP